MIEKVTALIKDAMKNKEKDRLNALRYIKSLLLENKTAKKPVPELDVMARYVKKLKESLALFPSDGEQYEKTQKEIEVVKIFLPPELEEAEVITMISEIKKTIDNPQMGHIMRELTPKIKGRFDGKRASELVKESLA